MANTLTFDILARDRASSKLRKIGAATAIVGAAVFKMGSDSVKAFTQAEQAQNRLTDAFARFPKLADVNIESLREFNKQLALKTRFDDDALASGQAVLAQFNLTGKQIQSLTPLVADFAAKTGRDLPTAAKTLGRAFLGNTRALKELGINYKVTGDNAKDAAAITELLREKVGGFAEKEGKTAAGQAAILTNQFGEMQESIGEKLLPVLLKLTAAGLAMVKWMQENKTAATVLGVAVAALTVTIVGVSAATKTWVALQAVAKGATIAWTAAQWLLNAALTANPIGIAVVALAALVTGLVIAYKKSETFREIVHKALKVVTISFLTLASVGLKVLRFILNAWLNFVNVMVQGAAKAFGWVPGVGDDLKKAAKSFEGFKNKMIGSLDKSIVKVEQLQDSIRGIKSKTVTITANVALQRAGGDKLLLQGRQHGGPVTAGRAYVVGERRPELFVPRQSGTIVPSVPSGSVNIYIENINGVQTASELWQTLQRHAKRNGSMKLSGITA